MNKHIKFKKYFTYILIISFIFSGPSIINATTRTFNFQGNSSAYSGGNGGEVKLYQGKKYTFNNTELVTVNANTKSRDITMSSSLMWMRWYGEKTITGGKKETKLGNTTKKTITKTYNYQYYRNIDTTSDQFYFNYLQRGGDSNYSFNLQIDF